MHAGGLLEGTTWSEFRVSFRLTPLLSAATLSCKRKHSKFVPQQELLLHQCIIQRAADSFFFARDGNYYRDPQLDTVQRVRNFGALRCKWDVCIKPLPSRLSDPCGREGKKISRARGGYGVTLSPRHNWTDARMNSQKLWYHT
ncbi:uncharacterized protein LOC143267454 [Peromyscus maniculatus bairdii]|uniref:uncharacterized protein LOC143267454 n=1 Tax=Peromyscus maniculatus bairdii TaxID=230844 RepID=UPI003FD17989